MKTFKIEIIASFADHLTIPEILKKPFRTLLIDAESENDAIEKTKKEMLKTTYRQFFPELNDRTDSLWFMSWSVQRLFPENYYDLNGDRYTTEWSEEKIIQMSESFIQADIFERIKIKIKIKIWIP